jgi:hypothetical protein
MQLDVKKYWEQNNTLVLLHITEELLNIFSSQGQFPEAARIGVKRLASHSGQGFVEFKIEVHLMAKLQQTNLKTMIKTVLGGKGRASCNEVDQARLLQDP